MIRSHEVTPKFLWENLDQSLIEVHLGLDVTELRRTTETILSTHGLFKKDRRESYQAISLQYADPRQELTDGIDIQTQAYQRVERKIEFQAHLNEVGARFEMVFKAFSKISLARGRLLMAAHGMKMNPHTDGGWPFCWRLHVPIITYPEALMHVEDQSFHLPANGNAFLLNVAKKHFITNLSGQPRYHLVFQVIPSLLPSETLVRANRELSLIPREAFQDYLDFRKETVERAGSRCEACGEDSQNLHMHLHGHEAEILKQGQWRKAEGAVVLCELCHWGPEGLHSRYSSPISAAQFSEWAGRLLDTLGCVGNNRQKSRT